MRPRDPASFESPASSTGPRRSGRGRWVAALVLLAAGVVAGVVGGAAPESGTLSPHAAPGAVGTSVPGSERRPAGASPATDRARFAVRIRQPVVPPRVDTGRKDAHGQAVTVACGTCHATSTPRRETRSAAELDEFHQGLQYAHGTLTCLSCHDAANYDQLRLADGRGLPFAETMSLCAQCHGPQFRDYTRGSHGGMTGYWDLSRGPRERNHCVDCHDPHAPRYPQVQPAFPLPPDRGLVAPPEPHHE